MNLVFIDLAYNFDANNNEMKTINYEEIIKFNAVMLDEKYRLKDVFTSRVKPEYTPSTIENAPNLEGVLSYFQSWLGEEDYEPFFLCKEDKINICHECTSKGLYHLIKNLI